MRGRRGAKTALDSCISVFCFQWQYVCLALLRSSSHWRENSASLSTLAKYDRVVWIFSPPRDRVWLGGGFRKRSTFGRFVKKIVIGYKISRVCCISTFALYIGYLSPARFSNWLFRFVCAQVLLIRNTEWVIGRVQSITWSNMRAERLQGGRKRYWIWHRGVFYGMHLYAACPPS